MEQRTLGRTGRQVSAIGQGCWQIGGDWGEVAEGDAREVLRAAHDAGITFFDTADVYGDGRSERLVGRFVADAGDDDGVVVATKLGRRADPHEASAYTAGNFRAWTDRSRRNLGVETLDLLQLHCPPPAVYESAEVFDALDALVAAGLTRAYGVSVETCDQALAAIARPHVAAVQIIVNVFRQKPLDEVLPAAREAGVGIIARVPLASGLLSGAYRETTAFAATDHRSFNRTGAAFDVGETFAGVPFEVGVAAAREVDGVRDEVNRSFGEFSAATTAQLALRWILDQAGVSTAIPGARTPDQARANAAAGDLPALPPGVGDELAAVYRRRIKAHVHDRW